MELGPQSFSPSWMQQPKWPRSMPTSLFQADALLSMGLSGAVVGVTQLAGQGCHLGNIRGTIMSSAAPSALCVGMLVSRPSKSSGRISEAVSSMQLYRSSMSRLAT